MTNLLERVCEEQRQREETIATHNTQRQRDRKVALAVGTLAATANLALGVALTKAWPAPQDYLLSGVVGEGIRQLLIDRSIIVNPFWSKPKAALRGLGLSLRYFRTNCPANVYQAHLRQETPTDNAAVTALFGTANHDGTTSLDNLLSLIDMSTTLDLRRGWWQRLGDVIKRRLVTRDDQDVYTTPEANFHRAAESLFIDDPREAEHYFRQAIERGDEQETLTDRITPRCVLGSFLERHERSDEASNVFGDAAQLISLDPETTFQQVHGCTNSVYRHAVPTLGTTFFFHTGEEHDVLHGYHKAVQLATLLGNSAASFDKPLALSVHDDMTCSVSHSAGIATLADHLEQSPETTYDLVAEGLDTILLLHLQSQEMLPTLSPTYFPHVDSPERFFRKFLEEEPALSTSRSTLGIFLDELTTHVPQTLTHHDYHPNNVIVKPHGGVCVIDPEKACVDHPFVDPVSLVENTLTIPLMLHQPEARETLFLQYVENFADSVPGTSTEDMKRQLHLTGVYQHLIYAGSAHRFARPEALAATRGHHITCALQHLDDLQDHYIGTKRRIFHDLSEDLMTLLAA